MEVKGNRFTSLGMGAEYGGTLEFEPTAIPRRFNMVFECWPGKRKRNLCIYEVGRISGK
jgi:hypothetical protein